MRETALLMDERGFEDGFGGKALIPSFSVVLLLHIGALAAIEAWAPDVGPAPAPPMAMSVELFSESLSPPAAAEPEAAPETEPEALPEPELKPPPKVEKSPSAPKPPPGRQEVSRSDSPPAAATIPDVSSASIAAARKNWMGQVMAHLERNKRYPGRAQALRQEGTVSLRFFLDRAGNMRTARLEEGSGHSILDGEGLAMLERAGRFPPPPPEIAGELIELVVPIRFSLGR